MENYSNNNFENVQSATVISSRSLVNSVFSWMFLALGLTTIASLLFYFVPSLFDLMYTAGINGRIKLSVFGWIVTFAPLGLVLLMGARIQSLSYNGMISLFVLFSILMGMSLSSIFLRYDQLAIFKAFLSASALFAVMAIAGYTTKTDLTKLGSILFIGLIGIIIASLINLFTQSSQMSYIISILGVAIFTGLTAYDMQKIKAMAEQNDGSVAFKKLAIWGALDLYLDFINIFLFLLRIFGGRRN